MFMEEKLYLQTRSLKRGQSSLDPVLAGVCQRVYDRLGVRPLNLLYDRNDIGPNKGKPRLNVIFDTNEDYYHVHKNWLVMRSAAKKVILQEWAERSHGETHETADVHLISDCFAAAAISRASEMMRTNHEIELLHCFANENVWAIHGVGWATVVFFDTELSKDNAAKSGVTQTIESACYKLLKTYDEFDYLSREQFGVNFDSKEVLDRDFEGNLYYYFK